MVHESTLEIGEEMKIQNIESFGYIQKFMSGNNISLHKIHSKTGSVPQEKTDNWMFNELLNLIKDYESMYLISMSSAYFTFYFTKVI